MWKWIKRLLARFKRVAPAEGRISKSPPVDVGGEFYFRETILDQLDYYMKCIARMKRTDRQAFDLYSQIGGSVVPECSAHYGTGVLSPWFRNTLPSFGAVFIGKTSRDTELAAKDDLLRPRFLYFTKHNREHIPPGIQRAHEDGAVYVVTLYWDDPEHKNYKSGVPQSFPVLLTKDGKLKLLRTLLQNNTVVRGKNGGYRGRTFTIPSQKWVAAEPTFVGQARRAKLDVEEYLFSVFRDAAEMYEISNSSVIRVSVEKNNMTAMFGVNIKRTPYFFKDRKVTYTDSNNRKRVFHIVRPHVRKNGREIKLHFRGERRFVWNGYNVLITVPGRHHAHISELNVDAEDHPFGVPTRGMSGARKIGAMVKHAVVGGNVDANR